MENSSTKLLVGVGADGNDTTQQDASDSNQTCWKSVTTVFENSLEDLVSYLNEYGGAYDFVAGKVQEADGGVNPIVVAKQLCAKKVNEFNVVVFAKDGCGYCARAKTLLHDRQEDLGFSMDVVNGAEGSMKAALRGLIGMDDITFPQIVVNGYYIGGADNLNEWNSTGQLATLLSGPRNAATSLSEYGHQQEQAESSAAVPPAFTWYAPLRLQAQTPDLFFVPAMPRDTPGAWYPRTWPWYTFQWCLHSNLVRYISFLQICIMIPAAALFNNSSSGSAARDLANVLLILLLIDLSALVAIGPSPLSPTGTISTYFMWKVRGNATAAVPYKFVWAFYLLSMIPVLVIHDNRALYLALVAAITNSAILVIFRF